MKKPSIRYRVLLWMDLRQWHCHHPRIHHFWEWVVMPRSWGGRYGLVNYIKWVTRRD